MPENDKIKKSDRAKERILVAARQIFAAEGYDNATIRAIALEATINQSMVIRYFGSKENLFAAVTDLDFRPATLAGIPISRLGEAIVRHVLNMWDDPKQGATLAAMMRASITNDSARERIVAQFTQQLAALFAAFGPQAIPAAPFIASQILGMTMARYIWRIPPIVAVPKDRLIQKIGKTVQRYLDDAAT